MDFKFYLPAELHPVKLPLQQRRQRRGPRVPVVRLTDAGHRRPAAVHGDVGVPGAEQEAGGAGVVDALGEFVLEDVFVVDLIHPPSRCLQVLGLLPPLHQILVVELLPPHRPILELLRQHHRLIPAPTHPSQVRGGVEATDGDALQEDGLGVAGVPAEDVDAALEVADEANLATGLHALSGPGLAGVSPPGFKGRQSVLSASVALAIQQPRASHGASAALASLAMHRKDILGVSIQKGLHGHAKIPHHAKGRNTVIKKRIPDHPVEERVDRVLALVATVTYEVVVGVAVIKKRGDLVEGVSVGGLLAEGGQGHCYEPRPHVHKVQVKLVIHVPLLIHGHTVAQKFLELLSSIVHADAGAGSSTDTEQTTDRSQLS
mmetsp:Transcript_85501/g.228675  ORF Transcript_85501/g.228675 Transcript_85501/m.228675 type:complete len:375 (+) Transcript_85501:821-1945(+)